MFEKLKQLRTVEPSFDRVILYGDGSGHAEDDEGDEMFYFVSVDELQKKLDSRLLPTTKELVKDDKVVIVKEDDQYFGQSGTVQHKDNRDGTYLVQIGNVTCLWYRRSSLKCVPTLRKVGDAVKNLDDNEGIVVKVDELDENLPYLVAFIQDEHMEWCESGELLDI